MLNAQVVANISTNYIIKQIISKGSVVDVAGSHNDKQFIT